MEASKPILYQIFPRLYTNTCEQCTPNGNITENGVGKMNKIDDKLLRSLKKLGITHIWYTGLIEHAHATVYPGITPDNPHVVKGLAGSPYAIKDYYDVDPDIADDVEHRLDEFKQLVERTHKAGMKVVLDFVPNHVARHYESDAKPSGEADFGANDNTALTFAPNNNFYYFNEPFAPSINLGEGNERYTEFPAKATGNDCFSAHPGINDWYETAKLNYGVDFTNNNWHFSPIPDTWTKMLHILQYWSRLGVDAFRCDMAFMVPVEFWNWLIPQIKAEFPDIIFIAELYDTHIYRRFLYDAHFDYLYDKVNLYDTLRAITCGNQPAWRISDCWRTVDGIGDKMLNFLENHDEQRIASPFFAGDATKALPALIVSATISKGPFLLYQGQELGEPAADAEGFSGLDGRTTIFDYWSIPTVRRWYNGGKCDGRKSTAAEKALRKTYAKILTLCNTHKAISQGGFFDLMYVNHHTMNTDKQFAYLRHCEGSVLMVVVNFDSQSAQTAVTIPEHAFNCTDLEPGEYNAVDLISGATEQFTLAPSCTLPIELKAYSGAIWKLSKAKPQKKSAK